MRYVVGTLVLLGIALMPAEGQDPGERAETLMPEEEEKVIGVPPEEELENRFARLEEQRDTGDFESIMMELEALLEEHPDNGEILWRLARTRTDVAEHQREEGERRDLFLQALEEAERAVELLPESSNAHLTKSVAAGRVALVSGTRRQIELSRLMKEYADKAIELDPENDLAYHLRGRWHYEVASLGFFSRNVVRIVYGGLPDASYRQAESDYRRAISLQERIVHRFELGRTMMEIGNRHVAIAQFERVLSLPPDDVTAPLYKERAEALLGKIR